MSDSHHISVPADLAHSAMVRDTVRTVAEQSGFDPREAGRFVLVADELFMNAVKYGSGSDDVVEISLSATAHDDGLTFTIVDAGATGITPAELRAKMDAHADAMTPHHTSGRGLAVITQSWMDNFDIAARPGGGLIISCTKYHSTS